MNRQIWTISNILSFSRIILLFPVVLLLLSDDPYARYWAIGVMIVGAVTDMFDGLLARKYQQETDFGKILDPLADKIGVGGIVVVLLILGNLPLWFVLGVVFRDVLILLGGIYISKTRKLILQSNQTGKWAVSAVAVTIAFATMNNPRFAMITEMLIGISVILLAVSFVLYFKRFFECMKLKPAESVG